MQAACAGIDAGRLCAVGHVSEDGLYTKEYTTVAFSGFIRKKVRSQTPLPPIAAPSATAHQCALTLPDRFAQGDSDAALEDLARTKGLI